jgi:hypothetical protein
MLSKYKFITLHSAGGKKILVSVHDIVCVYERMTLAGSSTSWTAIRMRQSGELLFVQDSYEDVMAAILHIVEKQDADQD